MKCGFCGGWRSNPSKSIICKRCKTRKFHYQYNLCYLCYQEMRCRWLDDIDRWVDYQKPQCSKLQYVMGFCKKHWRTIEQKEKERHNRDYPKY
jgi:hypothetical protein